MFLSYLIEAKWGKSICCDSTYVCIDAVWVMCMCECMHACTLCTVMYACTVMCACMYCNVCMHVL